MIDFSQLEILFFYGFLGGCCLYFEYFVVIFLSVKFDLGGGEHMAKFDEIASEHES